MKIYFAHGKESGPYGNKIKEMIKVSKSLWCNTISVDYRECKTPEERVLKLLDLLKDEKEEYILVGSSMGGYTSLVASEKSNSKGIFLLAPALYTDEYSDVKGEYKTQEYKNMKNVSIVHGYNDDVIPFKYSVKYSEQSKSNLLLVNGDHRLETSLDEVLRFFESFLKKILELK
jgi:predicted alpha/beta hydrolase family esterase